MLAMIVKTYDPLYILRVSDDMAIAPHRLPAALAQWVAMGTDYIGCMVRAVTCIQNAGTMDIAMAIASVSLPRV